MPDLACDLVLGGGGVRGVAHVGALSVLQERGWTFHRVAGASAGAMAGSLAAAGASAEVMRGYLAELDWRGFALSDVVGRLAARPLVGSVMERFGSPSTTDPLVWLEGLLEEHGVDTWADLALDDDRLPPNERYRLVVRCLDVVHRRVVRLPWDYHRYGLDPDEQSVAGAVRASMSVPLVFDPVPIGDRDDGGGLLVDGGIGSGFPVSLFDRRDGRPPEHPTFALRLLPRTRTTSWPSGDLDLLRACIDTMLDAGDAMEPVGVCDEARTVRLDASTVTALDVRLSADDEQALHDSGVDAMTAYLDDFDFDEYRRDCRGA